MGHLGVGGKNVNTCIILNILRIYVSFSFMRMILSTVYNRWGNIWWVGFDFGMDSTKIEENDWHLIYYVWWPHNPSEWRELRYKVWGCQFLLFLSYLLPGGCTKKGLRHKARSRSIRRTSSTGLEVGWIMTLDSLKQGGVPWVLFFVAWSDFGVLLSDVKGPYIKDIRKIFRIFNPPSPLRPHFTQPISTICPQNLAILKPPLPPSVRTSFMYGP